MTEPTPVEATTAFGATFDFRRRLQELFDESPLAPDELMFNLGLYVRSSLLVKFLVLDDLYRRFLSVPGSFRERSLSADLALQQAHVCSCFVNRGR